MPSHAVIKLWSGEVDATGELSGSGSFTAANFEPTAQMPVDELFGHIGASLSPIISEAAMPGHLGAPCISQRKNGHSHSPCLGHILPNASASQACCCPWSARLVLVQRKRRHLSPCCAGTGHTFPEAATSQQPALAA